MKDPNILYESQLDSKYNVLVKRFKPYWACLTISTLEGEELYKEEVPVAFDAFMGFPDMQDLLDWKVKAIEFIDYTFN